MNNMQISIQVGLGQDSVSKRRGRFIKCLPLLQEVSEKDPSHLEEAVSGFLNDCPRPGQPSHYTDEQIIRILETACRDPQELGYEASHWSLNLLVDAVTKEGIVESISAKTVSRFLNMGKIRPHLIRYWLHSSEKMDSPEIINSFSTLKNAFSQLLVVRPSLRFHILKSYQLLHTQDVHSICTYTKTQSYMFCRYR